MSEEQQDIIVRTFDVNMVEADGRTLIGRIVPYNTPETVCDPPDYQPYEEEWLPGVFDRNTRASHRVLLDFEHESGIRGVIGRGVDLHDAPDGAHAGFKVYDNADGDKALQMYHDGVLRSFSVYAKAIRSVRRADGVVQRVKAHLDRVALCREGAFKDAKVLAVRTPPVVEEPPDPLKQPLAFPASLAERLAVRVNVPGLLVQARQPATSETGAMAALRDAMAGLRAYIAAEPDGPDVAAARRMLGECEQLLAKDQGEG